MVIIDFDDGDNTYAVGDTDDYDLNFKKGEDKLYIVSQAYVEADMGDDDDYIYVNDPGAEIHAILGNGDDTVDLYDVGFAQLYGGPGRDTFDMHHNANVLLYGGGDRDEFFGHHNVIAGQIFGGLGPDYFAGFEYCGSGLTLYGGTGNDAYEIGGSNPPHIVENADQGMDVIQLVVPVSYVIPENVENLICDFNEDSSINFTITATGDTDNDIKIRNTNPLIDISGQVTVYAGAGNDTVQTSLGDDYLFGGTGNDTLSGGFGADYLRGDAGQDKLWGDSGSDSFVFDSVSDSPTGFISFPDSIKDYEANLDIIDLHIIDANTNLAGNQAFDRVGAPTGAAGQLWVVNFGGGNFKVYADVNGGGADFALDVHFLGDSGSANDIFFSL